MGGEVDPKGKGAHLFFLPSSPEYRKLYGEYRSGATQDSLICPHLRNARVRLRRHNDVAWRRPWWSVVVISIGKRLCPWRRKPKVRLGGHKGIAWCGVWCGVVVLSMEKSLCLWRRHRVRLEINTVLARGRGVPVLMRRKYRVCGDRSDGLPVGIFVVQSLQNLVEFRGIVVWRVFWLAWLRRMFHAL
jgi:hypothetical protein